MDSILDIADYSYGYPDSDSFLIRDIRMRIEPGECHCITGPTGSGKSTLLMAIQGVLDRGREQGGIRLCENGNRQAAGLVLQNPDTQILMRSIGAEVAFGLENVCVPPDKMMPMVSDALKTTGLHFSLDREPQKLSMGQKYRLILSALLAMRPRLLMIDEPSGQLDAAGLASLSQIIKQLKSSKMGILLTEHRPEFFSEVVDDFWQLDSGGVIRKAKNLPHKAVKLSPPAKDRGKGNKIICARQVAVSGEKGPVWSAADFEIYSGEMVAVCGENGSGKTTLMRCLAGMVPTDSGQLSVFGKVPAPGDLRHRVGYLFQDPSRQLFEDTVFREVGFQTRRKGNRRWKEKARFALQQCGIAELEESSPHKLSYGQQHLVAMAMVIAAEPELLILDDPFTGLDRRLSETIYLLLNRLREGKKTTVIVATHHPEDGLRYDRRLMIRNGCIIEE